jgi:hypothetical protein
VEKPFLNLKKRSSRGEPAPGEATPELHPVSRPPLLMQRKFSLMRQVIFFV